MVSRTSSPGERSLTKLVVGSRVFYPSHGVASVTGVEERTLGEGKQLFYVLEVGRVAKLLLPIGKVVPARLRHIVSAAKARELLQRVKVPPAPRAEAATDHAARKGRALAYAEALKSGSADRYTEVLNELLYRSLADKLSATEQQTLDTARGYFVGEIGAALKLTPAEVAADLLTVGG